MSLISMRKLLAGGIVLVVSLKPFQPTMRTCINFQPGFGAVNFTASPTPNASRPQSVETEYRVIFISERFAPLSCLRTVMFLNITICIILSNNNAH